MVLVLRDLLAYQVLWFRWLICVIKGLGFRAGHLNPKPCVHLHAVFCGELQMVDLYSAQGSLFYV